MKTTTTLLLLLTTLGLSNLYALAPWTTAPRPVPRTVEIKYPQPHRLMYNKFKSLDTYVQIMRQKESKLKFYGVAPESIHPLGIDFTLEGNRIFFCQDGLIRDAKGELYTNLGSTLGASFVMLTTGAVYLQQHSLKTLYGVAAAGYIQVIKGKLLFIDFFVTEYHVEGGYQVQFFIELLRQGFDVLKMDAQYSLPGDATYVKTKHAGEELMYFDYEDIMECYIQGVDITAYMINAYEDELRRSA